MNNNEDRGPMITGLFCGGSLAVGVAAIIALAGGSVVATVLSGLIIGICTAIATYATESN